MGERQDYLNWYEDKKTVDTQAISVKTLRELGYAVVLYYPEELHGIDPRVAETMFVGACNQIIEDGRPF